MELTQSILGLVKDIGFSVFSLMLIFWMHSAARRMNRLEDAVYHEEKDRENRENGVNDSADNGPA